MFNHFQLYVRSKSYVRINVVERLDPNLESAIATKKEGGGVMTTTTTITAAAATATGNHKSTSGQDSPTRASAVERQKIRNATKEQVLSYIRCEQCNKCLSGVFKSVFRKPFTEYSFTRFLQHLFHESTENYKNDKVSRLRESFGAGKDAGGSGGTRDSTVIMNSLAFATDTGKCPHAVRSRVFNIKDVEIHFAVGTTIIYSIKRVSMASDSVVVSMKEADAAFYKEALLQMKSMFKSLLTEAMQKLQKLNEFLFKKKSNKLNFNHHVSENIKACIEAMERERDFTFLALEHSKIVNYASLVKVFILEQRIHIGLTGISALKKEIMKRKFKQLDRKS